MSQDIKEITDQDIDSKAKALWLKAKSAYEMNNFSYAISLSHSVIKVFPGFLDARKLARKSSAKEIAGKESKKSLFGGSGLSLMKIPSIAKKNPSEAMYALEKELIKAPYDGQANDILHDVAKQAGMWNTAAFALETARKGAKADPKLLHKLAEFYLERELPQKAAEVYSDIAKRDPSDIKAVKGSKDATARASMKKQKWEEAGSFRDMMKSSEEAAELEAANRAAMTRDQLQEKLASLSEKYNVDNQNLNLVKQIAEIYEKLEDWKSAHSFFDYAYQLSNKDIALQNKATLMKEKASQIELTELEKATRQDPENIELKEKYEAMLATHNSTQLVEAKERVERNPTDPQLRYELGKALFNAGEYSEAVSHLQQAKRNPHIYTKVLLLLGKTFKEKNMHDLAIKQLSDALKDLHTMDSMKKEILYEKGIIHHDTGDTQGAIDCFKQIYEVDYGYRDVAKRVEESYSG